jgi:protein-disulfide isomerase
MNSCTKTVRAAVDRDLRDAAAMRIAGTPTFLIGRIQGSRVIVEQALIGNVTAERFREVLDAVVES